MIKLVNFRPKITVHGSRLFNVVNLELNTV